MECKRRYRAASLTIVRLSVNSTCKFLTPSLFQPQLSLFQPQLSLFNRVHSRKVLTLPSQSSPLHHQHPLFHPSAITLSPHVFKLIPHPFTLRSHPSILSPHFSLSVLPLSHHPFKPSPHSFTLSPHCSPSVLTLSPSALTPGHHPSTLTHHAFALSPHSFHPQPSPFHPQHAQGGGRISDLPEAVRVTCLPVEGGHSRQETLPVLPVPGPLNLKSVPGPAQLEILARKRGPLAQGRVGFGVAAVGGGEGSR
eukprot:2897526-Rhodomonas_salina.1